MGASQTSLADGIHDDEATSESFELEKLKGGRKRGKVKIRDVEAGHEESFQSKKSKSIQKRGKMKRVMTMGMRLKKGILHIMFNSVVPGTDVTSDFLTFLELLEHGDIKWAMLIIEEKTAIIHYELWVSPPAPRARILLLLE